MYEPTAGATYEPTEGATCEPIEGAYVACASAAELVSASAVANAIVVIFMVLLLRLDRRNSHRYHQTKLFFNAIEAAKLFTSRRARRSSNRLLSRVIRALDPPPSQGMTALCGAGGALRRPVGAQ